MINDMNSISKAHIFNLPSIAAVLLAVYILEGYILTNANPILGLSMIILIIHILMRRNITLSFKNTDILWLMFSMVLIIGGLLSINVDQGIKFGFNILILVITMLLLSNANGWQRGFYKAIWICSLIHVVATLLAFAFPLWISNISRILLTSSEYELNQYFLFKYGGNPGITGQIGLNAWFISIFIAVSFSSLIVLKKKKLFNSLFLFVALFTLLLANKRGLFIGNILAILVVTWSLGIIEKKLIKRILTIIFLIIGIISIIVTFVPDAQIVLNRLNQADNFFTGRDIIYQEMFHYFGESPFIGVGTYSIVKLIGEAGHNVYLQVLAENGLLGFLLFIFAILIVLFRTFRKIKYLNQNNISGMKETLIFSLYIQILFIVYSFSGNPLYNYQFISIYLFVIAIEGSITKKLINGKSEDNNEGRNSNIS